MRLPPRRGARVAGHARAREEQVVHAGDEEVGAGGRGADRRGGVGGEAVRRRRVGADPVGARVREHVGPHRRAQAGQVPADEAAPAVAHVAEPVRVDRGQGAQHVKPAAQIGDVADVRLGGDIRGGGDRPHVGVAAVRRVDDQRRDPLPLQRRDVRREHVARAADAGRVEHGGERTGAGRQRERAGDDGALAAIGQVPDPDAVPASRAGEAQAERAGRGGELAGELGGGDRAAGRRCRRRRESATRRSCRRPATESTTAGGEEAGGVATDEPPAPQAGSARPASASATSAAAPRARSAARRAASTGLRPPAGRRRRRPVAGRRRRSPESRRRPAPATRPFPPRRPCRAAGPVA